MSARVKVPNKLGKKMKSVAKMYPEYAERAVKEATFAVEKEIKKTWMTVKDGSPIFVGSKSVQNIRYPKRTTKEGLRTISGQSKAGVRTKFTGKLATTTGFVGINTPWYAVEHERKGRRFQPGFYAFLAPGFEATKELRRRIFKYYLRLAEKKAAMR